MSRPADAFAHPAVLASVGLLLLNDHVLKARWPCWLTGKLSDVAGLAFFPLLVAALLAPLAPSLGPRRLVAGCAAATAAAFAAVKCIPEVTGWYRVGLGLLQWPPHALLALLAGASPGSPSPVVAVTDPTDLLALPSVAVAVWVAGQAPTHRVAAITPENVPPA